MIFDLDPGEGVAWGTMQEATHAGAGCSQLGLTAFVKTSGGKGLHVVVPLAPRTTGTRSRISRRPSCSTWAHAAAALRGQERAEEPRGQDLRRLPAQRPRRHHGRGLVGPGAAGPGRVGAHRLGRPRMDSLGAQQRPPRKTNRPRVGDWLRW
jgi:hypothetical protein